jgi:ribonuclease BN (tRNA processing enzyme)
MREAGLRVILLGTGTPNPDPDRSGPSVAISVNGAAYIVDCGPGVVRRAAAAEARGVTSLAAPNLNLLFVTHLHSDHTLGLADLMLSPWTLGRTTPLEVYGPKGIADMARHLMSAYREDIKIRLHGLEPSNPTGFKVNAHTVRPGTVYHDANVTVRAFPVGHGQWRYSYGYRFDAEGRSIVISGDTGPSQNVVDNCDGCDILIHEVYSLAGFAKRPPAWQKYHSNYHTSSRELADIASKARPRLLVLYHQLFWGTSEDDLLREVRQYYSGKVVSAHDLDEY